MQFKPKTENDIKRERLLPAGEYDFTIMEAAEAVSKAGNPMLKLKLHVFDSNGMPFTISDYLMESVAFKLRHCAYAVGLAAQYESGDLLPAAMAGKSGKLDLVIREDKTGNYPPQNSVKDYIAPEAGEGAKPSKPRTLAAGEEDPNSPPF